MANPNHDDYTEDGGPLKNLSAISAEARYNQAPWSEVGSTIDTMSHRGGNRAEENDGRAESVFSYRSERDVNRFLAEHFGRTFNSLNDLYLLPTDENEWSRLDKQHSSLIIAFGGLVPCPELVEPLLADDGTSKEVLDVGCGTGSWAVEMARRFPHVAVKAVDLAPVPIDADGFPPNLEFEIDDVNLGLSHFYDRFDLVHLRLVRAGLTDNKRTILELQRCLRPGGMLIVIEADTLSHDKNFNKVKMARVEGDEDVSGVSDHGSWLERIHWEAVETHGIAAADKDLSCDFIDKGFWSHTLMDPATVVSGSAYLPVGPWATARDPLESQLLKFVGVLMRQNCTSLHRAFHPMLRKYGITQEILDEWSKKTQEELDKLLVPISLRLPFCIGRRRASDGGPAPPINIVSPDAVIALSKTPRFSHPFFETFHSAKEAADGGEKRLGTLGVLPTAAVRRAWASLQANA